MRQVLLVLALAGGTLAGCMAETDSSLRDTAGDNAGAPASPTAAPDTGSAPAPAASVAVTLTDAALTAQPLAATAGTISFQIRNGGTAPRSLVVAGGGEEWDSGPLAPGDSLTMSVVLGSGEYELRAGGDRPEPGSAAVRLIVR